MAAQAIGTPPASACRRRSAAAQLRFLMHVALTAAAALARGVAAAHPVYGSRMMRAGDLVHGTGNMLSSLEGDGVGSLEADEEAFGSEGVVVPGVVIAGAAEERATAELTAGHLRRLMHGCTTLGSASTA